MRTNAITKTSTIALAMVLALCVPLFASGDPESAGESSVTINGAGELPIVDDTYTLTVAAIIPPNITDISTNTATQWVEEMTNVHIEWQTLQWGGEGRNKANLMLSSGADLPDVFLGNQIVRGVDYAYGSQGLLLPLNDYLENESVHLKGLWDEYPLTWSQMQSADGNIYSIGSMSLIRQNRPNMKAWYNAEFMETLGMGIPTTTDGFLEMLRLAKRTDVNGNGDPNDEIPFTSKRPRNGSITVAQYFLMNAFVYIDDRRINVDEGGNLWTPVITEEFRDGLRYQHQLYAEELWDPESFVQDSPQLKQLVMGGDASRPVIISNHNKNDFMDADWDGYRDWFNNYPPLEGPDGHRSASFNPFSMTPGWGAITTEADEPLVAWRWLDFLATQDAQWRIYQGEEGTDFRYPTGGEMSIYGTPANLIEDVFMWAEQEQNRAWLWLYPRQAYEFRTIDDGDEYSDAARLYRQSLKYWEHVPADELIFPVLAMTSDEQEEYNNLRTEIMAYQDESWTKFVTGDLSVDSDWDEYVETIEGMGLARMLEIAQTVYDRQYR
jgi:putative aldouronate transport system substrate-binding protein